MIFCARINRRMLKQIAIGACSLPLSLFAAPASWASQECQDYEKLTIEQGVAGRLAVRRAFRKPDPFGAVEACPHVDGGARWSRDTAMHFKWCLGATPAQRASETEWRRGVLKICTAKRRELSWPEWDALSCTNYSGGEGCYFSSDQQGEAKCNALGNKIMAAVQIIRQDPGLLHDHSRDQLLYNSKYYHHYGHWTGFRCVVKVRDGDTKYYTLEGSTFGPRGPDSITKKPPKPPKILGKRVPNISVATEPDNVFVVRGRGFLNNKPVTIRVTDDAKKDTLITQVAGRRIASGELGTVTVRLTGHCAKPGGLDISANDGRTDGTGAYWSNTVRVTCR